MHEGNDSIEQNQEEDMNRVQAKAHSKAIESDHYYSGLAYGLVTITCLIILMI